MNTETKHTPGPWQNDQTGAAEEASVVFVGGRPIADCGLTAAYEEDCANARLIASAPDMAKEIAQLKADCAELLSALRYAETILTWVECKGDKPLGTGMALDQARQTIAKHSKV